MNTAQKAILAGGGALAALAFLGTDKAGKRLPKTFGSSAESGSVEVDDPEFGAGSGSAFAASLPKDESPKREALILGAVLSGQAMIRWAFVTSNFNGHEAVIPVMARALAIGVPGDAVRVTVNYKVTQQIADHLSANMMTPKVSDLVFAQADVRVLPPPNRPWSQDGTMAKTFRMIEQSNLLDAIVPPDDAGLVSNEGKQWVVSRRLFSPMGFNGWDSPAGHIGSKHNGPNYGFYQSNGVPIQSVGLAHDMSHTDYSQMVQLMNSVIVVDGSEMHVGDVLRDPDLAGLLSAEGTLPLPKHPDLAGGFA